MIDTPRTDTKRSGSTHFMGDWVDANFAVELERELNAANERIRLLISERDTAQAYADQKWKLRREFHDLFGTDDVEQGMTVVREMKDRIKRLEEALEGTVKWIVHLADSGDAGFWNPEEQSVIIAARAALQAKEAK